MSITKQWKNVLLAILLFSLLASLLFLIRLFPPDFRPPSIHGPTHDGSAQTEITIVYLEESFLLLPLYTAGTEGFWTAEGLAVKLQRASSYEEALALLLSGGCEIFLGGPEKLFYAAQQKSGSQLVPIAQAACKTGYYIVAREADKPFLWQDLKGKIIIGITPGELPAVIFNLILKENCLRPLHDVHLIGNLPIDSRQGAFRAGTGHYLLAAEPQAARLEKEGGASVVAALDSPGAPALITSAFMVTSEFRQNNNEACQGFVRAFQKGLTWINEHSPEDIAAVAAGLFPEDELKTLLRAVARYKNQGYWPQAARLDEAAFVRLQDLLLSESEVREKSDISKLLDHSFTNAGSLLQRYQIIPSAPTLKTEASQPIKTCLTTEPE